MAQQRIVEGILDRKRFVYTGRKTNAISFPLGGLGTGCIGLAGNGRLIDWEIFNNPNKGSSNGFSHFAIKAEVDGRVLDARVLHGDLHAPYTGNMNQGHFSSFGFGPPREYLTGVPHFREVVFHGEFPIAELDFEGTAFPGKVKLTAFNPFVPLNDQDSSIPAAFFEFEVFNSSPYAVTYTLAGTLHNPLPAHNINRYHQQGSVHWMSLSSDALDERDLKYGELVMAADVANGDGVSYCEYWFRGRWFDNLQVFWDDFTKPGPMKNRRYIGPEAGEGNAATLAPTLAVAPGETGKVRFVIAWYYPNRTNDWHSGADACACQAGLENRWKNYYATLFSGAEDAAHYALGNWDALYDKTALFKGALFSSDLPSVALDAVSANLAVLKSPTVMRLEDGTFYGFEGCHTDAGCCEGSCTHVWNYAQALPFLFPSLERSMREANYTYNQRSDGGLSFRLQLPLGVGPSNFRPCVDGQFGDVLKVYREWKISGDTPWLRALWPAVKRSIAFAWSPQNEDRWDPEKTGVLQGRQHHTLDMELFSPNAWLTGFYLGALKAGAEMAEHLGEPDTAVEYREIFTRGKVWADAHLFNGAYYHQVIDLKDISQLHAFSNTSASMVGDVTAAYWDDEHGEIKYQIAEGCGIDQVLAQWHADLYGLGEIFDPEQTRKALSSVFALNFKSRLGDFFNPCRVFGLNDEAGLTICSWPPGSVKPIIPVPYSQEVMTGFEYAAAVHMLQVGLVEQGLAVVRAVRDRFDGEKRNPWNEFECGSNYARSMASYALLNAYSGFSFDMVRGVVGFKPIVLEGGAFQSFWSLNAGWGTVLIMQQAADLHVMYGELTLNRLHLPGLSEGQTSVAFNGIQVAHTRDGGDLVFGTPLTINAGSTLKVSVRD